MNILYYIPYLHQSAGGTRQYAIALLKILAMDKSDNYFYVLHNNNDPLVMNIVKESESIILIPRKKGEKRIEKYLRHLTDLANDILVRLKWRFRFRSYNYLNRICKKFKIQIIHCPNQTIPKVKNVKKICTMHDVQEIHFPEFFTPEERRDRAILYSESLSSADLVIVSYDHIKRDLIKYFHLPENKIVVCLLEMKYLWFKEFEKRKLKDIGSLDLPGKFILYPANTWKHKNHLGLIEAVAFLKCKRNEHVNVVCTGSKTDHFFEAINSRLKELNLENQIIFLDIVDEETLFTLYQKCTGVVIPTIYEAGSFPLMESILMHIPVICSNVTSLPETIGNSQFVFDFSDIENMADKIFRLYNNVEYREQSIHNSKIQASSILRTNALEKIQMSYKQLA